MKFGRAFLGLFAMMALVGSSVNFELENQRTNPKLVLGFSGHGHYEKCPKHRANKRKQNRIYNKIARKSRQLNRRITNGKNK